jgi:transposase
MAGWGPSCTTADSHRSGLLGARAQALVGLYLAAGDGLGGRQALRRIAALYAIEAEIRGQPPDVRRPNARRAPDRCSGDARLARKLAGAGVGQVGLAQAIGYSLTRWRR